MPFEESEYYKKLEHTKVEMPFGNFYLCEKFIISEINDGVHYEWEMLKKTASELMKYYKKDSKLGYISNRINSYSLNPNDWSKAENHFEMLVAGAIVFYSKMNLMNATLEKRFFSKSIKRCESLNEAIEWMSSIEELSQNKTLSRLR